MNTYETLNRILTIANELTALYTDLKNELPPLRPADDGEEQDQLVIFPNARPVPRDEQTVRAQKNTPKEDQLKEERYNKKATKKSPAISVFLKSQKKEISKMDNKLQLKILKAINKPPRFHNRIYEKRAIINGISLYACALSDDECLARFLDEVYQKIIEPTVLPKDRQKVKKLPTNFHEFAMFYFENVKKRLVIEKTYYGDLNRYKNHIKPKFGRFELRSITVEFCQEFIDALSATGMGKTTDEVRSLLNGIFNYAVDRGMLPRSPIKPVVLIPHETVSGHPLTREEEKILFDATYGTEYQTMFAVILYTGMRANEIRTATLVGNMIISKNSKRKDAVRGKISWKRIPVCPNLAPFLEGITEIDMYCEETMRDKLNSILPNHQLKDLRKTFYTHCETFKVDDKARDEFVGHSQGKRHDAYSELPDEFLIAEAKKISYPLDIKIAPKSAPKKNRYGLAEKLGKPRKPRFNPQN